MWIASSRFVSESNKESKIINYVARINSCPPPRTNATATTTQLGLNAESVSNRTIAQQHAIVT